MGRLAGERLGVLQAPAETLVSGTDGSLARTDPVERGVGWHGGPHRLEASAADSSDGNLEELREIGRAVHDALAQQEDPALTHVLPWLWNVETSTGTALTKSGAEVGYDFPTLLVPNATATVRYSQGARARRHR